MKENQRDKGKRIRERKERELERERKQNQREKGKRIRERKER